MALTMDLMNFEVMWEDLEQGIIRQGDRENFANGRIFKR